MKLVLIAVLFSVMLAGCAYPACSGTVNVPKAKAANAPNTVEEIPALTSPEGFNRLLEQRWSLADIRTFCIPERRHNTAWQNLVATEETWEGELYQGMKTGFDEISWRANIKDDQVDQYTLGAKRGRSFWLLEIGERKSLDVPPLISPDPTLPHFVGHK